MNAFAKATPTIGATLLALAAAQCAQAETFECPFKGHPAILDMTYQRERLSIDNQKTGLFSSNEYWKADTGTRGYVFSFEMDGRHVLKATLTIDDEGGNHIFTGSVNCTRREPRAPS